LKIKLAIVAALQGIGGEAKRRLRGEGAVPVQEAAGIGGDVMRPI
jgi:hypothetical protein